MCAQATAVPPTSGPSGQVGPSGPSGAPGTSGPSGPGALSSRGAFAAPVSTTARPGVRRWFAADAEDGETCREFPLAKPGQAPAFPCMLAHFSTLFFWFL